MREGEVKSYSAIFSKIKRLIDCSLYAYCLFPQRVVAVIHLIWFVQVQEPLCAPRLVGSALGFARRSCSNGCTHALPGQWGQGLAPARGFHSSAVDSRPTPGAPVGGGFFA